MNTVMAIVLSRFMCNDRQLGQVSVPDRTRLAYDYCRIGASAISPSSLRWIFRRRNGARRFYSAGSRACMVGQFLMRR
jgi:hypothetical protein